MEENALVFNIVCLHRVHCGTKGCKSSFSSHLRVQLWFKCFSLALLKDGASECFPFICRPERFFWRHLQRPADFLFLFLLWMTELCWFYNIQSHMTTERYYVGFMRQEGLLKRILHLWHSQKHQTAIEKRQGCVKYSQAKPFSGARDVTWILLQRKEGELENLT